jgi:hypothetical protein
MKTVYRICKVSDLGKIIARLMIKIKT